VQAKEGFERLEIPRIYHPFIQGPNQETIQSITMETNTKINIPPPSVQKDEVTISGEKEGVAIAKDKILQIYKEKVDTISIIVQDFTVQLYFCDLILKYRTINLLWDI
jgi:polyribonucleotide nucleotidyltransferase